MKKRIFCVILAALLALVMVVPGAPIVSAATEMSVSAKLVTVLKTMEGFSSKPKWDYGQWSVGYGTECPADKLAEYQANGIPEAEAQALLEKELDRFEKAVNDFAAKYNLQLLQHQFDALVSFSYNCGEGWMSDLNGYFNTAVREGGTAAELVYGMCLFSTAGGEYILAERRLCEANMYLYGQYQAYNDPAATATSMKYVFLDGNGGQTRYAIYGFDTKQNTDISVAFTKIPTGVDAQGKPFVYTLAGWYTESGKQVSRLDNTLANGQILYARWKNPSGQVVTLPKGDTAQMTVTINADSLNVRKGPGTYYAKAGAYTRNQKIAITETFTVGGYTWGKSTLGWFRLDYTNYEDLKAAQTVFPQNGVVTGDDVNVRTGPGTNYNRVTQKDKGDVVVITEEATGSGLRWGKMTDGNWICLDYVRYVEKVVTVTGVTVARMPDKIQYKQNEEKLKLDGCILLVTYNDGSTKALSPDRSMVTSFSNATPGKTTVTLTCEGKKVTFQVEIIKPTVTFLNWDGTVIASAQYAWGETVTPPENPVRPSDGVWFYCFAGWDQPVVTCRGDAVYTAVYETDGLIGDADKSGSLDAHDATLILQWIAGWNVEIETKTADVDGDGAVTAADASQILQKIAGWNITFTPKE